MENITKEIHNYIQIVPSPDFTQKEFIHVIWKFNIYKLPVQNGDLPGLYFRYYLIEAESNKAESALIFTEEFDGNIFLIKRFRSRKMDAEIFEYAVKSLIDGYLRKYFTFSSSLKI